MSIFKNFSASTTWVIRLLWVLIAVDVIAVVSGYFEFQLLVDIGSGTGSLDYDVSAAADSNDNRQRIVGIIQVGLWLVAGVSILAWIRLANNNARALGATDMEFTPNWAIGWYFIPVANLWKPYQAMAEIWQASGGSKSWKTESAPGILVIWWFVWLASNIFDRLAFQLTRKAEEIPELQDASLAMMASDVISVFLSLAFLEVVKDISRRQLARPAVAAEEITEQPDLA